MLVSLNMDIDLNVKEGDAFKKHDTPYQISSSRNLQRSPDYNLGSLAATGTRHASG